MPKKSQSAVEFVVLASFMFLVILSLLAIISSTVIEAKEEGSRKIAGDIAEFVYKEIETAKSVRDGYMRIFYVPQAVNGINYYINITDSRELTVNYLDNEHVRFLPSNVSGNLSKGPNQIRKINGVIYVQPVSIS